MTANLVDNAVRYNHRGGHVTVETGVAEATVSPRGGAAGQEGGATEIDFTSR
ncbi:hypothetical protein AB1484_11940 [Parafrankia sp. FMc6]|uniref:hypothetical protein n=1 Tax=Parafrankia soli TaxID=2599596 RepID=UPI0034D39827